MTYPQQVLHQEAGVGREGGRQSRGRSVQPWIKGGWRDDTWDHHGPNGVRKKKTRCVESEILRESVV